jgi:hypothetical protein
MLKCATTSCSEKDTEHTEHPEGIPVFCGVCGVELSVIDGE